MKRGVLTLLLSLALAMLFGSVFFLANGGITGLQTANQVPTLLQNTVNADANPTLVNLNDYFFDADGDALAYSTTDNAAAIDGSTLTFVPPLGFSGEYAITITVSDGENTIAKPFTFAVPAPENTTATITEPAPLTTASDAENTTETAPPALRGTILETQPLQNTQTTQQDDESRDTSDITVSAICLSSVTECCDISLGGTYTLANNITAGGGCINVTASDVLLDCLGNSITFGSTDNGFGVNVTSANNVTVQNCRTQQVSSSLTLAAGVDFNAVTQGLINNVTAYAFASSQPAIRLRSSSHYNNITDSFANGESLGLQILSSNFNNVTNVHATANTTLGAAMQITGTNNVILNSSAISDGDSWGLQFGSSGNYNQVLNSNLSSGGRYALHFSVASHNLVSGVTAMANGTGSFAVMAIELGTNNSVQNSTLSTITDFGIIISTTTYNNFSNITATALNSPLIWFLNAQNNAFYDSTLATNRTWAQVDTGSTGNNFTNTTYLGQNGSIRLIGNTTLADGLFVRLARLNTTNNRAHLNSSNLSFLNTSAQITLNNLTFSNPRLLVDYEDDGTFADCNTPNCDEVSYTAGTLVFNASHFTTYVSEETVAACGDTLTANTTLTSNVSTTGDCFTIASSGVTLDCNGYNITGDGVSATSDDVGINNTGFENLTIRNCNIDDFNYGVRLTGASRYGHIEFSNFTSHNIAGVFIIDTAHDSVINNNTIEDNNFGIFIQDPLRGYIYNNTFRSNSYGFQIPSSGGLNNITDNLFEYSGQYQLYLQGTSSNQVWGNIIRHGSQGLLVNSGANNNNITNNTIYNHSSHGLRLSGSLGNNFSDNTFVNNTLHIYHAGGGAPVFFDNDFDTSNTADGLPIYYLYGNNSTIIDGISTKHLTVANTQYTVLRNINVSDGDPVTFTSSGNLSIENVSQSLAENGFQIWSLGDSNLTNLRSENPVQGSSGAIEFQNSYSNNVTNLTLYNTSDFGTLLYFSGATHNNTFNHTSLQTPPTNSPTWIYVPSTSSGNNTFWNTSFVNTSTSGSTINFPFNFSLPDSVIVDSIKLSPSFNRTRLNAANLTFLNTTAQLTLNGLLFSDARPLFDADNDGIYVNCNSPQCTEVSYSGGAFVFNVTHFSSYAASENVLACGDTITSSTNLTQNFSCSNSGLVIGADNIELDCKGQTINYSSTSITSAISANGRTNITVMNCIIGQIDQSFAVAHGLNITNVNSSRFSNISVITGNSSDGFRFLNSYDNTLVNVSMLGVSFSGSNTGSGVEVNGGGRMIIANSTFNSPQGPGVFFNGASDNLAINVSVFTGNQGLYSPGGTNNTFRNSSNTGGVGMTLSTQDTADGVVISAINGAQVFGSHATIRNSQFRNSLTAINVFSGTNHSLINTTVAIGSGGTTAFSGADSLIANNTFQGQLFIGGNNNTLTGNIINAADGLSFAASNNTLADTNLSSNTTWLSSSAAALNNSFNNTRFINTTGTILFNNFTVPASRTVSSGNLRITSNSIRLNSTNLSFLNASAQLTLNGLTFTDPRPRVDFEDDGTFVTCNSPQCTEVSYNGSTYVFDVSSFTTYISEENVSTCETITGDTTLTNNISSAGTCISFGADDITLDCNGYTITYANGSLGFGINATGRSNIVIRDCLVVNASSPITGELQGIIFNSTDNSAIINSTAYGTGGGAAFFGGGIGVLFVETSNNNNVTNVSGAGFGGIYFYSGNNNRLDLSSATGSGSIALRSDGSSNNFTNTRASGTQSVYHFGSSSVIRNITSNGSIQAFTALGSDNIIDNITAIGGDAAFNVYSSNSNVSNIYASGTGGAVIQATNSNVENLTAIATTSPAVSFGASQTRLRNFTATGDSGWAIFIGGSSNNNNISLAALTVNSGKAVHVVNSENNTLSNLTMESNGTWIETGNSIYTNFTNTTLIGANGTVLFSSNFTVPNATTMTAAKFNISENRVAVNTTNLSFINTSARITLDTVNFGTAQQIVDFEDDGSFEPCTAPDCTFVSYNGSTLVFDVSHFTSFSSTQGGVTAELNKSDHTDPLNTSIDTLLNYTINFSVTDGAAYNITINETYPAEVSFVTSSPSPTTGNFSWDAGNLSVNSTYYINITVNVSNALTTGYVLNNTVNATYFNSTGDSLFINVTENTTITKELCPVSVTTDYTLTSNISCSATAVNMLADNVVFDCAGNTIQYANATNGYGINATGRTNVTVRNCIIEQVSANDTADEALFFSSTADSFILNNTVRSVFHSLRFTGSGTVVNNNSLWSNGTGVETMLFSASSMSITNNTARASGGSGKGLEGGLSSSTITDNTFNATFIGADLSGSSSNIIERNTALADNLGLRLSINSNDNNVSSNFAQGAVSGGLFVFADRNILVNNTIYSTSIDNAASENRFSNNTFLGSGTLALSLGDSNNNTFYNTTFNHSGSSYALVVSSLAGNTSFNLTNFNATRFILTSTTANNITLTDTKFNKTAGTIHFPSNFTLSANSDVTDARLNMSSNRAFINSTNLTFLNTTAQITLEGIVFTDPRPRVDFEDDGTFAACNPPQCTEVSYTGTTYVFNVSSFTTYISAENTTECGDTLLVSTNLTQNISGSAGCLTLGASNIELDCKGYTIFHANTSGGLGVSAVGFNNVTIRNCNITQVTAGFGNSGNLFLTGNNSTIINVTAATLDGMVPISLLNAHNNTILNSTGTSADTANSIRLQASNDNFLSNVTGISVNGVAILINGSRNTITNSTGFGPNSAGIQLLGGGFNLINNSAGTSTIGQGISAADEHLSNITNSHTFSDTSDSLFIFSQSGNLRVNGLAAHSNTGRAIRMQTSSHDNTILNSSASSTSGTALSFSTAGNNTFDNLTLIANNTWMSSDSGALGNNLTNTTFLNNNGSIFFQNFTLPSSTIVGRSNLTLLNNSAFLNSTSFAFLNTTAQITLQGITTGTAQQIVDFEDDGTFAPCVPPDCTFVSYTGGTLVFDVSHFTSFSSTQGGVNATLEKTDNPDPLDVKNGTLLNYTINFSVTDGAAYNVTINETYPANVSFVNATPSPTTGNFSWDAGNLSVNNSYNITITINVSPSLLNGTVINNTVNATYQNSSGDSLFINVTENTTILNDPCPLNVTSNYTLGSNLSCAGTAVIIGTSHVTFDCAGNTINHSSTQAGFGVNISGFRTNVTVKNCIILQTNGSLNGAGIDSLFSNNNDLFNNTISGGASSAGISLSASGFSRISNSTITTNTGIASSASGILGHNLNITNVSITGGGSAHGISLTSDNNIIDNVTVNMPVAGAPLAIFLQVGADNNTINNSVLFSTSNTLQISSGENNTADNITANNSIVFAGQYNRLLRSNIPTGDGNVQLNGNHNLVFNSSAAATSNVAFAISSGTNNTIANVTAFATTGVAIAVPNSAPGAVVVNSTGIATSGHAGSASLSSGLTIANNTFQSASGNGFELAQINFSNFTGNTLITNTGTALRITSTSQGDIINNTRIFTNNTWLATEEFVGSNTLENTLFNESVNGSIYIPGPVTIPPNVSATHNRLNITNNRAFLNSTNLSFLNTSAQITLENITFNDPRPRVDFEDDGTFAACSTPQCTEVSYTGTTYVFNVSSFTTYISEETPACPGTITTNWQLNGSVESNGTCVTFGADNLELDCRGNTINYSATTAGNGVFASGRSNVTVKNCNIYQTNSSLGSSSAIRFSSTNDTTIVNTTTNASGSSSAGIEIDVSSRHNITNVTANASVYPGLFMTTSQFANATNLTGISYTSIGLNSFGGGNHTFVNVTGRGVGSNAGIQLDGDTSDIYLLGYSAASGSGNAITQSGGQNIVIANGTVFAPGAVPVTINGRNITLANVSAQSTATAAISVAVSSNVTISNVSGNAAGVAAGITLSTVNDSRIQDSTFIGVPGISLGVANRNIIHNTRAYDDAGAAGMLLNTGENNTIQNSLAALLSGSGPGILLQNMHNTSIINTTGISPTQAGIAVQSNSNYTRIINSSGEDTAGSGIDVTSGHSVFILNSTGRSNTSGTGIAVSTENNTITNSSGTSASGSGIVFSSSGNTLANSSGTSTSGNGIILFGSDHNVTNNTGITATASASVAGIHIASSQTLITNNTGTGNPGLGLRTSSGNNNTFAANRFTGSGLVAVYYTASANNLFINNDIGGTSGGFQFDSSANDNTLLANRINTTGTPGVQISGSSHRNNLTQNNITAGTSNTVYVTTQNNTIVNNTIANAAGASVQIDGSSNPSSGNIIANNSVNSIGSTAIILQTTRDNTVTNNTVEITSSGIGIILVTANRTNVSLNQITASSSSNGIHVQTSSNSNLITNNTVSGATNGILIQSGINSNNTFINNTVSASASAVSPTNAYNNTFADNRFTTSGSQVVNMLTAGGNTFENNTFTAGTSRVLLIQTDVDNNTFINNTLNIGSAVNWFAVTTLAANNTIFNTTFNQTDGRIVLTNATLRPAADIALGHLNISANRAHLNTVNLSFLNSSAQITLDGLLTGTAQTLVDFNDDGTFSPCVAPDCAFVSYNGSTFVFDVSHFTSFSSTDGGVNLTLTKTDSPDPVNLEINNTLTYTIVANITAGAAHNLTINETYPVNVTFISATPSPTTGNFSWLAGNLTNTTYNITITLNVSLTADNGSVLVNTVNATYQNSTGDALYVNVTENTTISNSVCPLAITTSYTLGSNISCPATAVNINANNLVFDCAGYTITYSTTSDGFGINATSRDNVSLRNCNVIQGNATIVGAAVQISGTNNSAVLDSNVTTINSTTVAVSLTSAHNNTIDRAAITSNNTGISITGTYNLVRNTTTASRSTGISVTSGSNNTFTNNSVFITGFGNGIRYSSGGNNLTASTIRMTAGSIAVSIEGTSNQNHLLNNTILGATGQGLVVNGQHNLLENNSASTTDIFPPFQINGQNNNATGNIVFNSAGQALQIDTTANHNRIINNSISSSTNFPLLVEFNYNGTYINNTVSGVNGAVFSQSSNNTIINLTVTATSGLALFMSASENSTVSDSHFAANSGNAVELTANNHTLFTNTRLRTNATWINADFRSVNNTWVNTTFDDQPNGTIFVLSALLPNNTLVNTAKLRTTTNKAFLNSTNLTFLNTTAQVTLRGLTLTSPNAIVDFNDDSLYTYCNPPQCTFVSFAGGTLVYDVASFTSYSSSGNVTFDKTDSPDPVTSGSTLNYTITINNTGADTIFNATVVETYPAGVSFVTSTPAPTTGNNTFVIASIAGGTSTTINITLTVGSNVANGTFLNNTANLTFGNGVGQNITLDDNETTTVTGFPQILTSKTDTPDPVAKGTALNYTITITNSGTEFAYNTTVVESYPSGTIFVSSTPAPTSGNDTFALGTLAAGASTTINITVNVSASVTNGSVLNNTYNVTFDNSTGQSSTVTNSTTTTVLGAPVVINIKSDTPDPVVRGQQLNYSILINNTGDDTAFNVTLSEVYPAGVSFVTAQPTPTGNNTFTIGTLAPNESVLVNITVTVGSNVANGTILTNNVNASFMNATGAQGNASDTETTTVLGYAELFTSKTDTPDPAAKGTALSYTITVTNTGDEIAYNNTVVESYPSGTLFVSSTPAPTSGNDTFALGTLAAGASTTINITVNVSASVTNGTVLNNTYNLTFENSTGQSLTLTNSTLTTVLGAPVVINIKSDTPDPVVRGQQLNYSILLNNTGDDTAFNVTLTEAYPAGVTLAATQPAPSAGNNTFSIGTLAPNESFLVNITVTVGSNVLNGTILTNNVNASFRNSTGAQGNVNDTETTTVLGIAALTVTKTDSDPTSNGSTVNYTITVTNTGDEIAYNVTAVEGYPDNTAFHNSSPAPTLGNNTFALGDLLPGASTTINITLNISATFNGTLNNTVNATFTNTSGASTTLSANSSTTVNVVTPPTPGGNAGGGGGGGGGGGFTGVAQTVSFAQQTLTQNLKAQDTVSFTVSDEAHELRIIDMTTTTVTVEVRSEPKRYTLLLGETRRIDANLDGTPDIAVRVEAIAYNKALITFSKLAQTQPAQPFAQFPSPSAEQPRATETPEPVETPAGITSEVVTTQELPVPPAPTPMGRKSIDVRILMGLGIAFAVIILIAVALLRKPNGHAQAVHKAVHAHTIHKQSRISTWLADRARRKREYARQVQREQERALELAKEQEQALHRQQAAERRAAARQLAKQEAEKEAAEKAAREAEKARAEEAAKAEKEKRAARKSWFSFRTTSATTPAVKNEKLAKDLKQLEKEMKEVEKLLRKKH